MSTANYTSYEVSKALHEAGIKLERAQIVTNPDGEIIPRSMNIVKHHPGEYYCYTAGELLREFPYGLVVGLRKWRDIDSRTDCYEVEGIQSDVTGTPEDTMGLALIEIKKGVANV